MFIVAVEYGSEDMSKESRLGSVHRIQVQSVAGVRLPLEDDWVGVARRCKFQGRKVAFGPFVNAILAHYLSLDSGERGRVVDDGLIRLERLMDGGTESLGGLGGRGVASEGMGPRRDSKVGKEA